ncbi:MAG: ABC transporter permease [Solirubrobacterales bacterium]
MKLGLDRARVDEEGTATRRGIRRAKDPGRALEFGTRPSIWERIPAWISIPFFVLVLVFIWQVLVWLEVWSEFVLPPPLDVAEETWEVIKDMATGGPVLDSFWITAREVLFGFLLAVIAGVGFGILVAETAFGRIVVMPFLVGINAAPKVAFAPIFVAWLGFGISAKVALAAFIAFFPLLIDTAAGLAAVDSERAKLFRSIRAPRWQTFMKLKLPSALPFIFAGLKTASVLAVVGAVVGEFLGGGAGLGESIKIAGSQLAIDRVFAFVIILSVAGYLFYALIAWLERRVVFWRSPELAGVPPTA